MTKLNQYINQHIDISLSFETIAEYMGMSRTSFYTKMKTIKNVGINTYITQLKMKRAMDLISRKKMRRSEVAYSVGYNDAGYFSTVFKQVTGKMPRKYQGE